jgi:hypothetical protein
MRVPTVTFILVQSVSFIRAVSPPPSITRIPADAHPNIDRVRHCSTSPNEKQFALSTLLIFFAQFLHYRWGFSLVTTRSATFPIISNANPGPVHFDANKRTLITPSKRYFA